MPHLRIIKYAKMERKAIYATVKLARDPTIFFNLKKKKWKRKWRKVATFEKIYSLFEHLVCLRAACMVSYCFLYRAGNQINDFKFDLIHPGTRSHTNWRTWILNKHSHGTSCVSSILAFLNPEQQEKWSTLGMCCTERTPTKITSHLTGVITLFCWNEVLSLHFFF